MNDEQAIRNLIERWFAAAQKGDVPTQLSLLAEDVVFMQSHSENRSSRRPPTV